MRVSRPDGGWDAFTEVSDARPARLAIELVAAAGRDQVRAVLLYGSRLVRAGPSESSAYDLVVVVGDYLIFHQRMRACGRLRRPARLLAALAGVLPPSVTAFHPRPGSMAKCLVLTEADFERGLSPAARDHFLKGRMVQKVALVHAAEEGVARWVAQKLQDARADLLRWAGPFFGEPFTPGEAARAMVRASYRGEVRPESRERADAVWEAQRGYLEATLASALHDAERRGEVVREGHAFRFTRPPLARERRRLRLYFARSKARATLRWAKHVVTFDGWLDYIVLKVERRTGVAVEVTPWERRLPYLLLWPKVVRVLRARPPHEGGTP